MRAQAYIRARIYARFDEDEHTHTHTQVYICEEGLNNTRLNALVLVFDLKVLQQKNYLMCAQTNRIELNLDVLLM